MWEVLVSSPICNFTNFTGITVQNKKKLLSHYQPTDWRGHHKWLLVIASRMDEVACWMTLQKLVKKKSSPNFAVHWIKAKFTHVLQMITQARIMLVWILQGTAVLHNSAQITAEQRSSVYGQFGQSLVPCFKIFVGNTETSRQDIQKLESAHSTKQHVQLLTVETI